MGTDAELTRDAFLGGRLHAWQPRVGYRAGVDAVLLAASVPARAGQSVLELGCGAAVASLCLNVRVPGLSLWGAEIQPHYAGLARRNAEEAGAPLRVVEADLTHLPEEVRSISFDHVIMNPPYFQRDAGSASEDPGRDIARGGDTALADWLSVAARRLVPGGVLSLIQRIERLPDVLAGMDHRLGAVEILPLEPREGRRARLFLLRARKGRKTPFQLRKSVRLHNGSRHSDAEKAYSVEVEAVLRHAHTLAGFAD